MNIIFDPRLYDKIHFVSLILKHGNERDANESLHHSAQNKHYKMRVVVSS